MNSESRTATAAHTPGPWTVEDFNADDVSRPTRFAGPCVVYADADCEMHPVADCSCNHTCRDDYITQANARLIAAAPEMLAALLAVRDGAWEHALEPTHNVPSKAIEKVWSAIAKATGAAS